MTTIAYRAGVLAADTMMSYADTPVTLPDFKLFIAGGYAVGVCGDCRMIPTIKRWFEDHHCKPAKASERVWDDGFDLLAMNVKGELFTVFADTLHPYPSEFFAVGSGRLPALGAMARGASAVEAVEIASRFDVHTGQPVQFITTEMLRTSLLK